MPNALAFVSRRPRLRLASRPSTLWASIIAGTTIAAAVGFSVAAGFVGRAGHRRFDRGLAAEVGAALGTILLAAYTAWLATTTRQEVALAIDEQRARDRPIIVVTPGEIGMRPLVLGQMVPVLTVRVRNIGLGPALELTIEATIRRPQQDGSGEGDTPSLVWTDETRAVWTVGQDAEIDLSLARFDEPPEGFRPDDFRLDGRYTDRRHAEFYDVELLIDAGLRDEQREAERALTQRAYLWISSGVKAERAGNQITYETNIGNGDAGEATHVILRFVRSEDEQPFGDPIESGSIGGNRSILFPIVLPLPHPWLSCDLEWRNPSSQIMIVRTERVYPGQSAE